MTLWKKQQKQENRAKSSIGALMHNGNNSNNQKVVGQFVAERSAGQIWSGDNRK